MIKIITFVLLITSSFAQWNADDCVLCLPFNAWSKGNGTSNQNTGEMPGYPDGDYDATFTNMTSGYGYLYNSGDGYCNFDGADDQINTSVNISLTNTNKFTIESKIRYNSATGHNVASQSDDNSNFWVLNINTSSQVEFTLRVGGVTDKAVSTDTLIDGQQYTITGVKDGGTIKIYIDGSEVSYDNQDTYGLGDKTFSNDMKVGTREGAGPFPDRMYWFAYYDDVISEARIAANHNAGNNLGEIAISNGADEMILGRRPGGRR